MKRFSLRLVIVMIMLMLPVVCASKEVQTAQTQPVRQFVLNDITVLELIDTPITLPSSVFKDIDKYPERLAMMPGGRFDAVTKVFVVKSGDRLALIDGGVGQEHYVTKGDTVKLLNASDIKPEQVTDIFMTHMDIDHVGGLVSGDKAVYPNAKLHISKKEYDAWVNDRGLAIRKPEHKALTALVLAAYGDKVWTFDFGDTVIPGVTAVDAAGHTPGHTAYEIVSGNKGMIVAGDFLHVAPVQLRYTEYCSIFDEDPQIAGQSRKRILERLSDSDIMLAAMHMSKIGRVRRAPSGGYAIVPVQ